jgi:hypothetical protein
MRSLRHRPFTMIALALLLTLFGAGSVTALAQQATPIADPGEATHSAHLHAGTCDQLGEQVAELGEVRISPAAGTPAPGVLGTPAAGADGTPWPGTEELGGLSTIVELALDDIMAEAHAIDIGEGANDQERSIACGEIVGEPGLAQLAIELVEVDGSGYGGQATLTDNGDGTTTVTIMLLSGAATVTGTPLATPAP